MADNTRAMRRWLIGVWVVAALIMIAYYAVWRYAAGVMETSIADWVEDQRAAGLIVNHGAIRRDGFPFFLRVHIDAPDIESPGAFSWTAERLSIDAAPYDLNRLIFSPSGAQRFTAEAIGDWAYSADSIRASIASDKKRGWVFSMNIDNARATGPNGAEGQLGTLIYDLAPAADAPTTLTLNLIGAAYSYRGPRRAIAIDQLGASLSADQTDFFTGPDPATRWRNAGGALTVHGVNAVVDEATISVSGSVSLDAKNRPDGALSTTLTKPAGLAGVLAASGALSRQEADAMIAGLTLAAMAQGGRIEAPIALHAGAATIAGVKLADLPAIP